MQEKFSRAIELVRDDVKNSHEEDAVFDTETLLKEVAPDLGGVLSSEAIFHIQEKKQQIVDYLYAQLHQIDIEGTVGEKGKNRSVTWDETVNTAVTFKKGGVPEYISKGQLLTAGLWDEEYFLDENTPRSLKKEYAINHARYQIAELYDHQIALSEMNKSYNQNTGIDDAYAAIHQRFETGELPDGIIAEKMVESYLTKLMYDFDMPYTIKNVTIYEDVEYKIDFIIEPKADEMPLGVGVQKPQHRTDIGIQFTTARSERTIAHKEKQLSRARTQLTREESPVQNLVLVTLPIEHVRETYEAWQDSKTNRRAPGGPDELWPEQIKQQVFFALLERVLPKHTVTGAWQQMLVK
jgi:hypothetical protein